MPVDVLPLKIYWHGRKLSGTILTLKLGPETCRTNTFLEPVVFAVDGGVLKIIADCQGKRGRAWIPLNDMSAGRSDVQYIPLVDRDLGPVADLHLIICKKPRFRRSDSPDIVRYKPAMDILVPNKVEHFVIPPASSLSAIAATPSKVPAIVSHVSPAHRWAALSPREEIQDRIAGDQHANDAVIPHPTGAPWAAPQTSSQRPPLDIAALIQARRDAQKLPAIPIVIHEARNIPLIDAPFFVELSVHAHKARTSLQPRTSDGHVMWGERFTIGIAPEDDLVLCMVTESGGLLGSGFIKGERLMGHKAHDVLIDLCTNKGVQCGQLLLGVGGGSLNAIMDWPITETRSRTMSYPLWLGTLEERHQALAYRPGNTTQDPTPQLTSATNQPAAPVIPPLMLASPSKPPFIVDRVPTDRTPRCGSKVVQRPWLGRGICLQVHEVKGRKPVGMVLQIQDAKLLQQSTIEDALNAYFMLEMAEDETITLRLLEDGAVIAAGCFKAGGLLNAPGKVEVPLYRPDGFKDCELVMERLMDAPVGYAFGSREEMMAEPAPMVLQ